MRDGEPNLDSAGGRARELARRALERSDPTGWFEPLYAEAGGDPAAIQWADLVSKPHLLAWLDHHRPAAAGRRALVVGRGLGDDDEELARRGLAVVAFDVEPSAVAWCRRRFPGSLIDYRVADQIDPPAAGRRAFDLVVEVYTLLVPPPSPHRPAMRWIAGFVARGGSHLVAARSREPGDDPGAMPRPLTQSELGAFVRAGLTEVRFDDFLDREQPQVRRFRVEYRRPPG